MVLALEQKLKYRLVGATVILALMAFFLPLILDSKKYKTEIVSQIPPMPKAQGNQEQGAAAESLTQATNTSEETGTLVIELDKGKDAIVKSTESKTPITESDKKTVQAVKQDSQADISKSTVSNTVTEKPAKELDNKVAAEKPKVEKVVAKPTTKPSTKPAAKPVEQVKSQTKPKPVPKIVDEAPDFKESAYVVQIGSFSNKENATKLVSDLRKQDYRAYQRISKDFSRVFVGPYPEKSIADARSQALSKIVGNQVKVIKFDPIKH